MRRKAPRVEPVWDKNRPAWDDANCGRDERRACAGYPAATGSFYGAVGAVALGIGFVNAFSAAQDAAWRGGAYDLRTPLFWELTSVVTILLVHPCCSSPCGECAI